MIQTKMNINKHNNNEFICIIQIKTYFEDLFNAHEKEREVFL